MPPGLDLGPDDVTASLEALAIQLQRLDVLVAGGTLGVGNARISRWCVGQHGVHIALVANSVAKAVGRILRGRSMPAEALSTEAREILTSRRIPRGIAQAPEELRIEEPPAADVAARAIADARDRWAKLADRAEEIAAAEGALPHPILGPLGAAEWVRFAAIHGAHHLAIVRDVVLGFELG